MADNTLAKLTKIHAKISEINSLCDAATAKVKEKYTAKIAEFNKQITKLRAECDEECKLTKETFSPQLDPEIQKMSDIIEGLSPVEVVACSIEGELFKLIPLNTKVGTKLNSDLYLLASDEKIGLGKALLVSPDFENHPFCCRNTIQFSFDLPFMSLELYTPIASCWLDNDCFPEQQRIILAKELEDVMFKNQISTLVLFGSRGDDRDLSSYAATVRFRMEYTERAHLYAKCEALELRQELGI